MDSSCIEHYPNWTRIRNIRTGKILITLKNEVTMSCRVPIFIKIKTFKQRMDTFCTKFYKTGLRSVEIMGRETTYTLRKVRLSIRRFLPNSCLLINVLQTTTTLSFTKILPFIFRKDRRVDGWTEGRGLY